MTFTSSVSCGLCTRSQPEIVGRTRTEEVRVMKTMAIRLDDDVSAQLTAIAQLESTSVAELIRQAIATLISQRRDSGTLAEQAKSILSDIDREANAKKEAIQALFGSAGGEATPPARGRRGRNGGAT